MSTAALSNLMLGINAVGEIAVAKPSQAKHKPESDLMLDAVNQTATTDNNFTVSQDIAVGKQSESFKDKLDENISIESSRYALEGNKTETKVPGPGTTFNS